MAADDWTIVILNWIFWYRDVCPAAIWASEGANAGNLNACIDKRDALMSLIKHIKCVSNEPVDNDDDMHIRPMINNKNQNFIGDY